MLRDQTFQPNFTIAVSRDLFMGVDAVRAHHYLSLQAIARYREVFSRVTGCDVVLIQESDDVPKKFSPKFSYSATGTQQFLTNFGIHFKDCLTFEFAELRPRSPRRRLRVNQEYKAFLQMCDVAYIGTSMPCYPHAHAKTIHGERPEASPEKFLKALEAQFCSASGLIPEKLLTQF